MRSPAADIALLCREGVRAVEEDRADALEAVMTRLAEIGRPARAGTREEIERALAATRRLHAAVRGAADRVSAEIEHVRRGRRALTGYEGKKPKAPRAIDVSV